MTRKSMIDYYTFIYVSKYLDKLFIIDNKAMIARKFYEKNTYLNIHSFFFSLVYL